MNIVIKYEYINISGRDIHTLKFNVNISRLILYKCIDTIKKSGYKDIYISLVNDNKIIFYEKYYNVGYKDSFDELYEYLKIFNQLNK